jgi:hypothetical protein
MCSVPIFLVFDLPDQFSNKRIFVRKEGRGKGKRGNWGSARLFQKIVRRKGADQKLLTGWREENVDNEYKGFEHVPNVAY